LYSIISNYKFNDTQISSFLNLSFQDRNGASGVMKFLRMSFLIRKEA